MSDVQFAEAPYSDMGPSLLSQQPIVESDWALKEAEDWQTVYTHLESRLGMLRSWRWSWWAYWGRLAAYFNPRRYHWVITANRMAKGSPINDQIVDSTGLQAVETCASGMWSGLTNPARPWLKLRQALPWVELDADAKMWLEDSEQRLYTVLSQSNFYTEMAQSFQDLTVFGTAPGIIYEDFEDVIRVYTPCAGEYYLASGARFSCDTLYREFVLTVAQIVEMFTIKRCPDPVQKLWAQGGSSVDVEFVVCHAIEPNFPIAKRGVTGGSVRPVPKSFTFREIYWLRGQPAKAALSMRGFHQKPFYAMRWSKVSNEPYGRSPCMNALGDNMQVQQETRRKAEFIEKGVRPPMGANPELKNEPSSIVPGNITYFDTTNGKKGFFPLFEPQPAWLSGITADIDMVNKRMERALFVDVFMAITQMQGVQPRNELELTKRDLERLQKLGPVIDLVEGELQIAIQRILDIMNRRRMLKPMPESLKGVPLKIEFTTIMRIAQRSATAVSIKDFLAVTTQMSAAAKSSGLPDPLRKVNMDKAAEKYADVSNVPSDLLFTEDQVNEQDKARAQAQQQAAIPGQAGAAVDAAKSLSETSMEGGSALSALLGNRGGAI